MFGDINLNELERVMDSIGENIAGSSDVFLKVDTDEFLSVYDEANMAASTSISDYLADCRLSSGFRPVKRGLQRRDLFIA